MDKDKGDENMAVLAPFYDQHPILASESKSDVRVKTNENKPLKLKIQTLEQLFENWDGEKPEKIELFEQIKPIGTEMV